MTNLPGVTPVGHGMEMADGVLYQNASFIGLFRTSPPLFTFLTRPLSYPRQLAYRVGILRWRCLGRSSPPWEGQPF
jgi:hypothetical protein